MIRLFTRGRPQFFLSLQYPCSTAREILEYDVAIVGAGVAGLSTAIRLKQHEQQTGKSISVCVLEKGGEVGNHILSGNCFETRSFDELFPNWQAYPSETYPPLTTKVTSDNFHLLTEHSSLSIPPLFFPKTIHNHHNYIISLSQLTRWMNDRACEIGVDVFPGTPANEVLYDEGGNVRGIVTQDYGVGKMGIREDWQRGIEIRARQTVFAEGCRGSLSEKVIEKFNLRENSDPQMYGIGLKEVWEVPETHPKFQPGYVQHTVGWPLERQTYGGSFMYHMKPNLIHFGLVIGLNYTNPYLNPYEELQRLKYHPQIKQFLEGGQCIAYGARALNSGGYFSIPKLVLPGGMLVGCSAGFMNVLKIKGSHTAIKSGIEAANAIFKRLIETNLDTTMSLNSSTSVTSATSSTTDTPLTITDYQTSMENSWVWSELYSSRNFKNSFKTLYTGLAYAGLYKILEGKEPFNLHNPHPDSTKIAPKTEYKVLTLQHRKLYTQNTIVNELSTSSIIEIDPEQHTPTINLHIESSKQVNNIFQQLVTTSTMHPNKSIEHHIADSVQPKSTNLLMILKVFQDKRNCKLMHKIVYIVKHVRSKWLKNILSGKHLRVMVDPNSNNWTIESAHVRPEMVESRQSLPDCMSQSNCERFIRLIESYRTIVFIKTKLQKTQN